MVEESSLAAPTQLAGAATIHIMKVEGHAGMWGRIRGKD